MTEGRKEVWATCGHCSHTFVIYAPLPAPVEVVCRAMKNARCPNCRRKKQKLYMAREADILAALSQNAVSSPDGGADGPQAPQSHPPAPISSNLEVP
jgi:hypothetical protein